MSSQPASVRALLEGALDPDEDFEWSDVERRLDEGTARLWQGPGCAMVTEYDGDCIHVWLGGGTLDGLLALRPFVEREARWRGCKTATINGRLGWDRVLKPFGYVRKGMELEKVL